MNANIIQGKDAFDEDAILLKITAAEAFNNISVEIAASNEKWSYQKTGSSSNQFSKEEELEVKDMLPYEITRIINKHPEKLKSYLFNLNITLLKDKIEISSGFYRLSFKKAWGDNSVVSDFQFEEKENLQELTDFSENYPVNAKILTDIKNIANYELLDDFEELMIQVETSKDISKIEVKMDMYAEYGRLAHFENSLSIDQLSAKTKIEMPIQTTPTLLEFIDENINLAVIKDEEKFILNTEINYTDLKSKKQISRIQSHLINNPWFLAAQKTKQRPILILKELLDDKFPEWKGEIKENDVWAYFNVRGYGFQYGLKDYDIYLHLSLGVG